MKKSRLIALFLTLAMMFSLCAAAAPEAEKDSQANSVKAAAQEVLSASAMNMWMYEDNDVTKGTIQELAATPAALSAPLKKLGLSTEEVSAFSEDIFFLREKTEYFKTMREEQDIRRNDFQLHYFFDEPEINGDHASLYVVENISFHYPEFPDVLSEATNYYNMELVWVDGRWLVAGIAAEGDDFDEAYKGTGFTAANAEACFAAAAERAAENNTMDINELAEKYGFTVENEAEAQALTTSVFYNYNPSNAAAYAQTYVSQMFGKTSWGPSGETDKKKEGRTFWNQNFKGFGPDNDCQNFASQCVWAGFNGSNSKNQIYNTSTNTHSPIMDKGGSYKWYGTIPGQNNTINTWTLVNRNDDAGLLGFEGYVECEKNSGNPDMVVKTGILSKAEDYAKVYSELLGAVLHIKGKSHAIVVTDVRGPSKAQILYCGHTADRKSLSLAEEGFEITGDIYYYIPQQMKIRSAPEIKITATLLPPKPVGTTVTVGGMTDQTCYSLAMTVTPPDDFSVTTTLYNTASISKALQLTGVGLCTITITAQKTVNSDPVVYVYTIRAY